MSQGHRVGPANTRLRRRTVLLGAVACVLVLVVAAVYLRESRESLIADESAVLEIAADVAAAEIAEWWRSGVNDSEALARTTGFAARARSLVSDPTDSAERELVRVRLLSEIEYHVFDEVVLLAPDGTHVETVGTDSFDLHSETVRAMSVAASTGRVAAAGPYITSDGVTLADWVVPLSVDGDTVAATAVLRSHVSSYWSPDLDGARSVAGVDAVIVYTAESGRVRALVESRSDDSGLHPGQVMPYLQAGSFPPGAFEALDAEGREIVAAVQPVEGTELGVAVVSDKAAVLAPLLVRHIVVGGAAALMLVVLGLIGRLEFVAMQVAAAEDRQAELEGLVAERTAELERTVAELAEAGMHKDRFLARVSHDFRTPLNAIIGFSDLLGRQIAGPLGPEQMRQIAMINDGGRQLLELVNDVLDLSTISAGGMTFTYGDVVLQDAVSCVTDLLESEAASKGVAMRTSLDGAPILIRTDEARLRQVLVNIVGNAVKYTDAGYVQVTATTDEHGAVVIVRDTGCGIPAEDIPYITSEFFRSRDNEPRPGSGLGLAISDQLVRMLGGALRIESEPGVGTTVTIALPLDSEIAVGSVDDPLTGESSESVVGE